MLWIHCSVISKSTKIEKYSSLEQELDNYLPLIAASSLHFATCYPPFPLFLLLYLPALNRRVPFLIVTDAVWMNPDRIEEALVTESPRSPISGLTHQSLCIDFKTNEVFLRFLH